MNKSVKNYYKRLDWIRIISCLMVLLYHLNILKGGFLAVCTFFTLSGYLSCVSALNNRNFSLREYYINRLKKLYIPLLIVTSITVILAKYIPFITWMNLKQETISVILGYNNFWQLKANLNYFTRHVNSPFMHLWYISILMQFDLLFPIAFIVLKNINKKMSNNISTIIVFLLAIVSTITFFYMSKTQDIMLVYYNTFARSFSIFWGVLLALLQFKYDSYLPQLLKSLSKLVFIVYILLLINFCIFISSDSRNYAIYMIISTIISLRLIRYSIILKGITEKINILDKVIAFFSKFSYEIYLVQYPIIFFLQPSSLNNMSKVLITVCLTFIIAYILHISINYFFRNKFLRIIKIIFLRFNYNNRLLFSYNRGRPYCRNERIRKYTK